MNKGLFNGIELTAIIFFSALAIVGLGSTGCGTYEKDVRSPAQEAREDERFGLDAYKTSTFVSDGLVDSPELDIEFTSGEGKSLSNDLVIEKPVAPNHRFSCESTSVGSGCKQGDVISAR